MSFIKRSKVTITDQIKSNKIINQKNNNSCPACDQPYESISKKICTNPNCILKNKNINDSDYQNQ